MITKDARDGSIDVVIADDDVEYLTATVTLNE
jgi:hypothetical protein